jgi:microcystin-dependent protein
MDGIVGFIIPFSGNFAPGNWQFCHGQILLVADNSAIFSLLGYTYGGNGTTTFALPDLRGRAAVCPGQGPGLSDYVRGVVRGEAAPVLSGPELPAHTHNGQITITPVAATTANRSSPVGGVYAKGSEPLYSATANSSMRSYPGTVTTGDGGPQPFSRLHPALALNYIICVAGAFPSP